MFRYDMIRERCAATAQPDDQPHQRNRATVAWTEFTLEAVDIGLAFSVNLATTC